MVGGGTVGVTLPRIFTPPLRDLSEPDATWGHDFIWFCDNHLRDPLSDWQEWLAVHSLEVLTKEKATEFALIEDDPRAELTKIERLYGRPLIKGGHPIPNGRLRFTKIVILISRQNGKTDFVKKLIKWALFRKRLPEIMAAAQTLNKAMELWDEILLELQQDPRLASKMDQPRLRNGSQAIWTRGKKGRYRPVGIDENAGRGDTVDLLYIDELRTQKDYVGVNALEATTTVPDNGLLVTTSNAGSAHSVVLREYRKLAMKPIEAGTWEDTRQGLFEWSADPMADIDDEEGWKQANPDLGNGRITLATLRGFREAKTEASFRTEHLCQWVDELDDDIDPIIEFDRWARRSVPSPLRLGYRCLAVEVSPLTGRTKFVSAGETSTGKHLEIAPVDEQLTVDQKVAFIKQFIKHNDPVAVVLDDKTDAVSLVDPLRRAGVDVVTIGYGNLGQGYRTFLSRFDDGRLTNDGSATWLDELRTTRTRDINGGREVLIDRYKGEPQALMAAVLALWGLETFTPVVPQVAVKTDRVIVHGAQSGVVPDKAPKWSGATPRRFGQWS